MAWRLNAKFHYTGPTGPAWTRTDFVGDPHGPNEVSRRPGPQKSPCGSVRARVVEFSYNRILASFIFSLRSLVATHGVTCGLLLHT